MKKLDSILPYFFLVEATGFLVAMCIVLINAL